MTLVLDIGGTNIRIAEVSKTSVKNKLIVPNTKKKDTFLKTIFQLIDKYPKPNKIGIGIAGFVKNGIILNSPNLPDIKNLNLAKILKSKYKCPVLVENDANCAGLAELKYGSGKGKKNIILLTLGTGVGGAIILNGKLYKGNGFAGEPGHMKIHEAQLESKASGTAVIIQARKQGIRCSNALDVELLARQGNKKAIKIYKEVGKNIGQAILSISYLIDPELFILGGGFSRAPFIMEEIQKVTSKDLLKRKINIVKAKFGDNAGLIGAGLLPPIKPKTL
ncbi:hypothetical protein COU54_05060 [Candidatus Pacearchaeota archaeon CG10_big_fil_rev_8_21_14_0_10_31_24]|nr:MAG: hypothetical protein COU54_05060 [Candidatus Pacearchaeota archaeon CG10_big_fil_rev_8_21_14_0_10_31_24]